VEVESEDGPKVTFVDVVWVEACLRTCAVVPIGLIDIAFFGANPEGGGFIRWEVEGSDGYLACFVMTMMHELQSFLPDGEPMYRLTADERG